MKEQNPDDVSGSEAEKLLSIRVHITLMLCHGVSG